MKSAWKADAERQLMDGGSPPVLTTAMLHALATAGRSDAPAPATFSRWVGAMADQGKLKVVTQGVYLNRLGHRDVSPAAASHWVRHRSVVSLSWVLEQERVTNNFGDTVTCVIPIEQGWPNPQVGERRTRAGTFRFFAMPAHLVDERAGKLEDIRDLRFDYPRTTPEKALLDWIYLGASTRSRLTRPPFDLDLTLLDRRKLARTARGMNMAPLLHAWMRQYAAYQSDKDVMENSATELKL